MRILMFCSVDPTVPNASITHLDGVASVATELSHEVTLVMPKVAHGKPVWASGSKPYTIEYLGYGANLGVPRFLCSIAHLPWLAWKAATGKFDLIYVRSSILSAFVTATARLFGSAPVITEHNGWICEELSTQGRPTWVQAVARRLQVLDARASHVARCVTPGIARKFSDAGVATAKLLVAGNGTDLARFRPIDRSQALAAWGLDPDNFYLGFIGSLAPWHGLTVAVQAMASVFATNPKARLLVAGDGPERKTADALARQLGIADKITFFGHIPPEQAPMMINCFDLALAPFVTERNSSIGTSALKVRDYSASARAILSTDIEGVAPPNRRDWIRLCAPDDADAFAGAAIELMGDPAECRRLGAAARRYAEENFSWTVVVGAIFAAARTRSAIPAET